MEAIEKDMANKAQLAKTKSNLIGKAFKHYYQASSVAANHANLVAVCGYESLKVKEHKRRHG